MEPSLQLCDHFSRGHGLAAPPALVLDHFNGPVSQIVLCSAQDSAGHTDCTAAAWLELLDWNATTQRRVFAVAPLPGELLAPTLRAQHNGSCDVQRADAEIAALLARAGPQRLLAAIDVERMACLGYQPTEPQSMPTTTWQERLPAATDDRLFRLCHLSKH